MDARSPAINDDEPPSTPAQSPARSLSPPIARQKTPLGAPAGDTSGRGKDNTVLPSSGDVARLALPAWLPPLLSHLEDVFTSDIELGILRDWAELERELEPVAVSRLASFNVGFDFQHAVRTVTRVFPPRIVRMKYRTGRQGAVLWINHQQFPTLTGTRTPGEPGTPLSCHIGDTVATKHPGPSPVTFLSTNIGRASGLESAMGSACWCYLCRGGNSSHRLTLRRAAIIITPPTTSLGRSITSSPPVQVLFNRPREHSSPHLNHRRLRPRLLYILPPNESRMPGPRRLVLAGPGG